ncbi:MAG: radical SAM protein [Pseudomonadota bacterium]
MAMLIDRFQRHINYLRISVTDKCNLRCRYCMPEAGIVLKKHEEILSLEELHEVAAYAVSTGFTKIRLTGGEPLVRKNIEFLVEEIGRLPGLKDFGMTTNGSMLADFAHKLKARGLHRVNISLDSLEPEKYREITRGGDLQRVFEGIDAARAAGLIPIKLNVVLIHGWNDDEKDSFLAFGREKDIEVRFIPRMDLKTGHRGVVECDTMVGLCDRCNRLRLTCDGLLKPCLFSGYGVNVREAGIAEAFALALRNKPEAGVKNEKEVMCQIGG